MALLLGCLMAAADLLLWPSAETKPKADPDSVIHLRPDGTVEVETGVSTVWPGVELDFLGAPRDLRGYDALVTVVSNMTDCAYPIYITVKGFMKQGNLPGAKGLLPANGIAEITLPLKNVPMRLDAPLEFKGMRGFPIYNDSATTYELDRVTLADVHRFQANDRSHYAVLSMKAVAHHSSVVKKAYHAATFKPFVDRFGQFRHDDWPGKIHSEAELEKASKTELEWLGTAVDPIPGADRFGGWGTGPQLKATGFFRTEKIKGKWWLVDPDGRLFFSVGIAGTYCDDYTLRQGREDYFEWLPTARDGVLNCCWNLWYGAHERVVDFGRMNRLRKWRWPVKEVEQRFVELMERRYKAWGINTLGCWSLGEFRVRNRAKRIPYTEILYPRIPKKLKNKNGKFQFGEPISDVWDPAFEAECEKKAAALGKRIGDDPWCLGVFIDNELAWKAPDDPKATAERYFSIVCAALRKHCPNHLILGTRFAWAGQDVWRVCAKYCDVVSLNWYDRIPSQTLPPGSVDRPLLVGEFHFGAFDRGHFHTGLVAVGDQRERAEAFKRYVRACVASPHYVGCHWFQLNDQPVTGRPGDGENFQCGFLTICDTPYPEMVEAAREVAGEIYR